MTSDEARVMSGMKALEFERLEELIGQIACELFAAQRTYPPFHSAHEGFSILKEEVDELWDAVRWKQGLSERREELMKQEAIQVAAMALRFLFDLPGFKN